jgi:hypothetical protein
MCGDRRDRPNARLICMIWDLVHKRCASGERETVIDVPRYVTAREGFVLCEDADGASG